MGTRILVGNLLPVVTKEKAGVSIVVEQWSSERCPCPRTWECYCIVKHLCKCNEIECFEAQSSFWTTWVSPKSNDKYPYKRYTGICDNQKQRSQFDRWGRGISMSQRIATDLENRGQKGFLRVFKNDGCLPCFLTFGPQNVKQTRSYTCDTLPNLKSTSARRSVMDQVSWRKIKFLEQWKEKLERKENETVFPWQRKYTEVQRGGGDSTTVREELHHAQNRKMPYSVWAAVTNTTGLWLKWQTFISYHSGG